MGARNGTSGFDVSFPLQDQVSDESDTKVTCTSYFVDINPPFVKKNSAALHNTHSYDSILKN